MMWILEDEEILIVLRIRRLTKTELHELNTVFSGNCKWTEGHGESDLPPNPVNSKMLLMLKIVFPDRGA